MVIVFVIGIACILYCGFVSRWARSQLESRLISRHRDFMRSIKVRGAERLDSPFGLDQYQDFGFSIEIDGEVRSYESLFSDTKTLRKLNDLELLRLAQKFQKNKRFTEYLSIIVFLLGSLWMYLR